MLDATLGNYENKFVITQKNYPIPIPMGFTTTHFEYLFPGLVKNFGDHKPLKMIVELLNTPKDVFETGEMGIRLNFDLKVYAKN